MKIDNSVSINTIQDAIEVASIFQKSGLFGTAMTQEQAIVKVLAGKEIGVGPFIAMNNIDIIQGKTQMNAKLMSAKIKSSSKYNYKIIESNNDRCILEFFENGDSQGLAKFTYEEAEEIKSETKYGVKYLVEKDNWKYYRSDMLFARALSRGARRFAPDVIMGIYVEGELDDIPVEINNNYQTASVDLIQNAMENSKIDNIPMNKIIQEAEVIEVNSVPEIIETTNTVNTKKSDRPFSPEVLKKRFKINSAKLMHLGSPVTANTIKSVNIALQKLTVGAVGRRIKLVEYFTGKGSTKDISEADAQTLIKWMGFDPKTYDPNWTADSFVQKEYELIIAMLEPKQENEEDLATKLFGDSNA
jgi:hypothetical protein